MSEFELDMRRVYRDVSQLLSSPSPTATLERVSTKVHSHARRRTTVSTPHGNVEIGADYNGDACHKIFKVIGERGPQYPTSWQCENSSDQFQLWFDYGTK